MHNSGDGSAYDVSVNDTAPKKFELTSGSFQGRVGTKNFFFKNIFILFFVFAIASPHMLPSKNSGRAVQVFFVNFLWKKLFMA